jgi:multisubunit Na+/H+ antiporter MnhC subunit
LHPEEAAGPLLSVLTAIVVRRAVELMLLALVATPVEALPGPAPH